VQRRQGMTPVQWLDEVGALHERSIIGHGIFLDHNPWVHWPTRKNLGLLANKGATVAYCPTVFGKRGINLRSFGEYKRNGINLGIGTDTYPLNFIEEMRNAVYLARAVLAVWIILSPAMYSKRQPLAGPKRSVGMTLAA
jgi:5-methylthioadenosine/S-adenosylhomocysteine deaminase